jgi:hypothetical protein
VNDEERQQVARKYVEGLGREAPTQLEAKRAEAWCRGPRPTMDSVVYPCTIIATRYGGTYEGALFVAFNDRADAVDLATADDTACSVFFSVYERLKPIGRGDTAQAAYDDLFQKVRGAVHVISGAAQ